MGILEVSEWTNIWWENAPDTEKMRVMLVGDSISVGYRGYANQEWQGEILGNAFSTSKALDNPWFLEEFDLIMKQNAYSYALIHFNNGLHGWHLDIASYETYYEKAIQHILQTYSACKLALVLSTPLVIPENPAVFEPIRNDRAIERNAVVTKLAEKYHLCVNDLYTPMAQNPTAYFGGDGCHYNPQGCQYQGKLVADFVRNQVKID